MRLFRHLFAVAALFALGVAPARADEFVWLEGEAAEPGSTWNRHSWYQDSADLRKDLMSPGVPGQADGQWLGHWAGGDPGSIADATWQFTLTEGGAWSWWIRLNPTWVVHRISVDGGPFQLLDTRDFRELVNVVDGIDVRWLAWVKAGEFDLTPGPHSVTLRAEYDPRRDASHGGVDCLCLVNYPWEPAGPLMPGQEINPPAPDAWYVLHAGDDPHSPESITDMSGLTHAPAGIYGPLQPDGDGFVFRDRPGERVRFLATNVGDLLPTPELWYQQARLWRKYGINMVRFHPLEDFLGVLEPDPGGGGGRRLDPGPLDDFDHWFALVKREGIYVDLSLFYPHVVTPDDNYPQQLYDELTDLGAGKDSAGLVSVMPGLQDAEWEWARTLLEHTNPYTGMRYADDPALAIVEARNEDSIFWHYPLNGLLTGDWPLHLAAVQQMWMDWLLARYGDDAGLAAAWGAGMRPGDSVSNPAMGIYGAWQMDADGPLGVNPAEQARMGDFIRFLAETQRAGYERRRDRMRAAGFQGIYVTTAWRAGGPAARAANLWTDDAGDAIDRHAYTGGGDAGWYVAPGNVYNQSHLPDPGSMILGGETYTANPYEVVLYQVENKPVVMSEWNQIPPNEWRAEILPLVAFYGMGLQGWDAVMHFASSRPRMGSGWPGNARGPDSFVTETPAYLGQFPAVAFAIHNGHFSEAEIVAARRLDLDTLFSGIDPLSRDIPSGAWPGEQNVRTPPSVGAIGRITFLAEESPGPSQRTDWDLYWDQAAETVTGITGEQSWDYGNEVVLIRSPKTQAVIGRAGGGEFYLPGVQGRIDTPFVSLIFTPLDDVPLIDSTHILITALARDRQWGTEYSPDGTQLIETGGPPLLMEPVQARIEFFGPDITSARVVDIHGVPTSTEVERTGNIIVIDGRYRTYYYEVRRMAPAQTCLHRTDVQSLEPLAPERETMFLGAPGPDGISLDPSSPLAQVPYICPFQSGDADPDPGNGPLVFYQVTGPSTRILLDRETGNPRFLF